MNEKVTRQLQSYTQNIGFFLYAVKKTERLARAIYLITNFFSDNEPIKWKLRNESISLLENFSRLTDSTDAHSPVDLSFIKNSLRNSLATLGVAHTGGLISEMNYSILKNEYETLLRELEEELGDDGKHSPLLFPKDFFAVTGESRQGEGLERYLYGPTYDEARRQIARPADNPVEPTPKAAPSGDTAESVKASPTNTSIPKGQSESIKDIKDTKRTPTPTRDSEPRPASDSLSRTRRRDIILQLVKDRKEISVKDAAREIQDVSEKTLQREIVSLVDEGVLERVGSRRWSRYRFAS